MALGFLFFPQPAPVFLSPFYCFSSSRAELPWKIRAPHKKNEDMTGPLKTQVRRWPRPITTMFWCLLREWVLQESEGQVCYRNTNPASHGFLTSWWLSTQLNLLVCGIYILRFKQLWIENIWAKGVPVLNTFDLFLFSLVPGEHRKQLFQQYWHCVGCGK